MIRARMPYVGSVGALDMVNFGPLDTVPPALRTARLHVHNPQVTLMRTTPAESVAIGRWIGEKLNQMDAPVRFFLPEGGVSALDAPGQAVPRSRGRRRSVPRARRDGAPDREPPAHPRQARISTIPSSRRRRRRLPGAERPGERRKRATR